MHPGPRLLGLILVLLFAATGPASGHAPLPFPRPDLKAMQGKWEAISYKTWVQRDRLPGLITLEWSSITVVVEGEVLKVFRGDRLTRSSGFQLDVSKKPGWISLDPVFAEGRRVWGHWGREGLYKLEGDTLTICEGPGGKRPADFGGGWPDQLLMVLQRLKK